MGFIKNREYYQVAISLDGMWFFSKQEETKLLVQNSVTGEHKQILNARPDTRRESIRHVEMAAKSINGKWLILSFKDNTFTEWYLPETYKNLINNKENPAFLIRGVSLNSRWVLRETKSGRLQVQDFFTGKVVNMLPKKYGHLNVSVDSELWRKIAISNHGNFVLMHGKLESSLEMETRECLFLWDLNNYPEIVTILETYWDEIIKSNYPSNVSTIAVSADEKFCIVGFNNGVINIYELKSDRKVYSCQENKAPITCVAMSPDNQILISGTNNGIITVRNFQSQAAIDFKLDTVVNFKLDTEVAYCSFHSEQPFIIVGDIQEQIHLFEQVLSQHSSDENASPEQSSTSVVSEQPTIISKRIRLQAVCGEDGYIIEGNAIGPGNLQIELYNQNRLIYQDNDFIPKGKMRRLSPRIRFPNEPWQEEDIKGYISLQTPDNKFICRVDLTISCLITNLDVLKHYKDVVDLTFSHSESYLNQLLGLNERLFGLTHRKTEETIDRLIEFNKTLNQDGEVELLQARKQEIKSNLRTETVDITYSENQKIFWYNCSYIILNLRPEDIIESDSHDSTHSDIEKFNHNQAIDYRDSLGRELEEVWFLLQTLTEPGIDRFEYLGKAWKKFKPIVSIVMVDYKEQLQKFLTNLREASISSQLMLVLRNPKNLPYFTIAKIFSSFFVTIFLISTIAKFSISNVSNWFGPNQVLSNSLLILWGIFSIASYLVLIVVIPINLRTYVNPDEVEVKKYWSNIILGNIIGILLISPFCFLGIIIGGVQGIPLGIKGMEAIKETAIEIIALINTDGYWFSIIATYCFSIYFVAISVFLGSWVEWIVRGKRKRNSPSSINDIAFLPALTTLLGYQKYFSQVLWSLLWCQVITKPLKNSKTINYVLWSLLGVFIGIGFSILIGNYFGDNSFKNMIIRAASGAIIGIFLSKRKPIVGALAGLTACVYFSFNYSLKSLITVIKNNTVVIELILIKLLGGGIGFLLGGGIGFIIGIIFGFCFLIIITMIGYGVLWLLFPKIAKENIIKKKIIKDFQERGYNSFFGVIFMISTALLGSILGMIPTILSIAK